MRVVYLTSLTAALALHACTLNFDRYVPADDAGAVPTDTTTLDTGPPDPPAGTCSAPTSIPAAGGAVTLRLRAEYTQHRFPCGASPRPAQYFVWTPARGGRADIQAVGQRVNMQPGTAVDVVLDMRTDECPDGGAVGCNDDSTPPGDNGARLQPMVAAGRTYYIIVGAFSPTPPPNPITLTVTSP